MTQLKALEAAADIVYRFMPPTPQIVWPLLSERLGMELWVKHENHTPVGSFKLRGAAVYLDDLTERAPGVRGVVAASRGNYGQGIGAVARRRRLPVIVVVPHGNSLEKNSAMRAHGVEVIEHGDDFEVSYAHAVSLAEARGMHMAPSFHPLLVAGTASYGLELFRAVPDLDAVYVPIGQGSGICGVVAARDALNRRTEVVGVVSESLPAYALSFDRGEVVTTGPATSIADGMSIRVPVPEALEILRRGVSRMVVVPETAIRAAMRHYFTDTHNVAEGAGAVALAALAMDRDRMRGRRAAVVLSGGNVDRDRYAAVLLDGNAESADVAAAGSGRGHA